MKYLIKASCKDCDFKGNWDEVYNHCKVRKHGGFGSHCWSSHEKARERCNMTLDKNDTIKAVLQASLKEWFEELFDGQEKTDKALISRLFEYYAIDKLPQQIEGDDIEDVIHEVKTKEFVQRLRAFAESMSFFDEQQAKPEVSQE